MTRMETQIALHSPHRFKIGQRIYEPILDDWFRIKQYTRIGDAPAYFVEDYDYAIPDSRCILSSHQ